MSIFLGYSVEAIVDVPSDCAAMPVMLSVLVLN